MAALPLPRRAEFQAVILALQPTSVLYPLSLRVPPPLLPVANSPLLLYQLSLLARSKFQKVLVVTLAEYADAVSEFLAGETLHREGCAELEVEVVAVKDQASDGDALRQVKDKITLDFVVLSGDLVTEASIHALADVFRMRDASVAMLMKEMRGDMTNKDERKKRIKAASGVVNYVALVKDGPERSDHARVVVLQSSSREDSLALPKQLLRRQPQITLRTDLQDAQLYIFRRWVLDLLDEHPRIESVRDDLLPYLAKLQFRGTEVLSERLIQTTKLPLAMSHTMSSSEGVLPPEEEDRVRCYALIVKASGSYCCRADSLASYGAMNYDVATLPVAASTPWAEWSVTKSRSDGGGGGGKGGGQRLPKSVTNSMIGANCEVEGVSMKDCVIGNNCKIGKKSKLNRCILMDGVVVGEGTVLQNSVLCTEVSIGARCNINGCHFAHGCTAEDEERLSNEQIAGNLGAAAEFASMDFGH